MYTDAQHSNPLCRVAPVKDAEKGTFRYDKEKYREMILDGGQSALGYFSFDRTVYGDKRNTTPRKWRWLHPIYGIVLLHSFISENGWFRQSRTYLKCLYKKSQLK